MTVLRGQSLEFLGCTSLCSRSGMLLLFGSAWPYQQQTPTGVPNSVATATVVVGFWDEMVQSIGVVMKIGIWISWFHGVFCQLHPFQSSVRLIHQFGLKNFSCCDCMIVYCGASTLSGIWLLIYCLLSKDFATILCTYHMFKKRFAVDY